MKKNLFLAASVSLILYVLFFHDLSSFYNHPERLTYLNYDKLFNETTKIAILFIFLLAVGMKPVLVRSEKSSGNRSQRWWTVGFFCIMLPLLSFILYVNPHGIFSWSYFSSYSITAYVPTVARTEKIALFDELTSPPEVVILGSSRSFTIPSSYVMQETGYRTFNMAVNGGGPLDFLVFGRYIFSKETVQSPIVLIVELVLPSLDVKENPMPVSMIPYLNPNKRLETASNALHDVISLQSVSDMLFQFSYAYLFPKQPAMVFMPDGTGVRAHTTVEEYKVALERTTRNFNQSHKCSNLSLTGMEQLEQLIDLSAKDQSAILFYRSPLNADYLDSGGMDHPDAKRCESLFDAYMSDLVANHPNIFFRDLTYYEPVSSLRGDGYYDAHHLKTAASQLVIDALAPNIKQAADWALQQRTLISKQ